MGERFSLAFGYVLRHRPDLAEGAVRGMELRLAEIERRPGKENHKE